MLTREKVVEILSEKWAKMGVETTETGTIRIGHRSEYCWLNELYRALSEEEVKYMEERMEISIPGEYREFLLNCGNGMCFLLGEIALHGLTSKYKRDYEAEDPFSLIELNQFVPENSTPNMFFIGSYYDGRGYRIYIDTNDKRVYFCTRGDATPITSWNSIEEMLTNEVPRISALYGEDGEQLDLTKPTAPINLG